MSELILLFSWLLFGGLSHHPLSYSGAVLIYFRDYFEVVVYNFEGERVELRDIYNYVMNQNFPEMI